MCIMLRNPSGQAEAARQGWLAGWLLGWLAGTNDAQ